ncbi:MAG: hypothetical protein LBU43_10240 [Candidatus Accumulibacter sp.]|nr:hypothetical protein [Accumulibacter sp.]
MSVLAPPLRAATLHTECAKRGGGIQRSAFDASLLSLHGASMTGQAL